jgi:hypothetical protein
VRTHEDYCSRRGAARGPRSYTPEVLAARREILWARIAVWIGSVFALLTFVPNGDPRAIHRDDPTLILDVSYATDVWARWNSVWFIRIAQHGYDVATGASVFFPLYPGLVALSGRALLSHYVLGGYRRLAARRVPPARRLAEDLLGRDVSRRSVPLLAVFPMSLFLQAARPESCNDRGIQPHWY